MTTGLPPGEGADSPSIFPFGRTPHEPEINRPPPRALAAMAFSALLFVSARTALELRYFLLDYDDFDYLLRAALDPWQPDDDARLLSTNVLYRAGVLLGAPSWFFMIANAAAFALMLGSLIALLRRAGWSKSSAWTAAALWGISPASRYLLCWAAGFQQLLGTAVLLLSIASAVAATLAPARRSLVSFQLAAMALTAAGVFIKFPLFVLAPLSVLVFSGLVVAPRPSMRRTLGCAAALALSLAVSLWIARPPSLLRELGQVRGERLGTNITEALQAADAPLSALVRALLAVAAARLIVLRLDARKAGERFTDVLRSWATAIRPAFSRRLGRAHPALFVSLTAALWLSPFLANRRYFAAYYLTLPTAVFAALAATWLVTLLPARGAAAAAIMAMLAAFPYHKLGRSQHQERRERIAALVTSLRDVLRGRPEPERLVLAAACAGRSEDEAIAREDLRAFVGEMSGEAGVRWATGFWNVKVVRDEAGRGAPVRSTLFVSYCQGLPLRIEER